MGTILEVSRVRKQLGKNTILNDVFLQVKAGQAVAIIGPSGAGKSTLLSIMGLLQKPDSGGVFLNGKEVTGLSATKTARYRSQSIGYVFQRAALLGSLNVLDNVLLPASFVGKEEKLRKKAIELLHEFGLADRLKHKPEQLSLGQIRITALVRALLLEPEIILADEPTNDLDPALAHQMGDALLKYRKRGKGVVLITHDMQLASRFDRVLYLEDGLLKEQTPDKDLAKLFTESKPSERLAG